MQLNLVIANARLVGQSEPVSLGIADGSIAAISPRIESDAPAYDAEGCLVFGGFVETHIHLDKALILDRRPLCEGTLEEAIALTAKAKAGFTEKDVYARAARVTEMAILQGTTRLRSFVEIDPRAGLVSFEAIKRIKTDYAFAIDIEICAFIQEGLTNEPETGALIESALANGADLVGGCPYTDPDPVAHVAALFDMAERFGVALDFHADFDLDPDNAILPEIIAQTRARGFEGRVSVGHVTKLAAMEPERVATLATELAEAGVAVTILPPTDLYLTGRDATRLRPRGMAPGGVLAAAGVTVSLSNNNILNPFTPFGDASLCRAASLFAHASTSGTDAEIGAVFNMVTSSAARLLGAPYGVAVGAAADLVVIDAPDPVTTIRASAPVLSGWKRGRQTFRRDRPELLRPSGSQPHSVDKETSR